MYYYFHNNRIALYGFSKFYVHIEPKYCRLMWSIIGACLHDPSEALPVCKQFKLMYCLLTFLVKIRVAIECYRDIVPRIKRNLFMERDRLSNICIGTACRLCGVRRCQVKVVRNPKQIRRKLFECIFVVITWLLPAVLAYNYYQSDYFNVRVLQY